MTEDIVYYMVAFWCLKSRLVHDHHQIDDKASLWNDVLAGTERQAVIWTTYLVCLKGLGFMYKLWLKDKRTPKRA